MGIFPMADSRDAAELFWVEPRSARSSRSTASICRARFARTLRSDRFTVTLDRDFAGVHRRLRRPRGDLDQRGIEQAMLSLHASATPIRSKCGSDGALVGGLYGVKLGRAFFGESMFSRGTDASKVALAWLVARLKVGGFTLLDCQFMTAHLASLGAVSVPRSAYVALLSARARRRSAGSGCGRRRRAAAGAASRRPTSARSTGCSPQRAMPAPRARAAREGHRAALGPDVVDRMLDDVERRGFLVQPAREHPPPAARRGAARRAGRRRRSAARSPTARSSRRRAGERWRP